MEAVSAKDLVRLRAVIKEMEVIYEPCLNLAGTKRPVTSAVISCLVIGMIVYGLSNRASI